MDTLKINVRRLKDGEILSNDTISFPPISYQDTLIFPINNQLNNTAGTNLFEITIDPENKINEHDEFNNSITYSYNLQSAGTINLYPQKFSIVSELNPHFLVL